MISPLKVLVALSITLVGTAKFRIVMFEQKTATSPSIATILIVGIARILLFIRVKSTATLRIIIKRKLTVKLMYKSKDHVAAEIAATTLLPYCG